MNDKPILVTGTDVDHEAAARVARQFQDAIDRAIGVDGNIIVATPGESVETLRERVRERIAVVGPGRAVEALRAMRGIERVELYDTETKSPVQMLTPPTAISDQGPRLPSLSPQARRARYVAWRDQRRAAAATAHEPETRNQRKRRRRKARRS